ncbi:MAG: O-antigen ligase family protein [Rhodospirillales bacterium]|nr:O-antigen ligase family protein [Rhodospirillales bacterium]
MALINGYLVMNQWNQWALVNKGAGWFVLMAYMMAGSWLTTNYGSLGIQVFLRPFLSFFILFMTALVVISVLRDFDFFIPLSYLEENRQRLAGLSGNRNAYGLLLCVVLCLITWPVLNNQKPFYRPFLFTLFWAMLPLALIYNNSRTLALTVFVLLLVFSMIRLKNTFRRVGPPLIAGIMLAMLLFSTSGAPVLREHQGTKTEIAYSFLQESADDAEILHQKASSIMTSETVRMRVFLDAFSLWQEKPLTGIGLGRFLSNQFERYGDKEKFVIDIIDCTPLWLLTETGLIGFSLFAGFYLIVLYRLWRGHKDDDENDRLFGQSVALILLAFTVMSLFHELLYSRYLWLLLGMALARPVMPSKHHP